MATKSGFQLFHMGALISKYTDQSNNVYYIAKTVKGNKFLCTGKTLEEIKKNIEKIFSRHTTINFEPVAGYTINEAIAEASKLARQDNALVITKLNDILLYVTKKAQIDKFVSLYQKKLNMKYKQRIH